MAELTNRKQNKEEKTNIKEKIEKTKENNENTEKDTKNDEKNENNVNQLNKKKKIRKRNPEISFCDIFLKILFYMIIFSLFLLSIFLFIQIFVFPSGNKFNFGNLLKTNSELKTKNQRINLQIPLSFLYSGEPIHFEKERLVKCKECEETGSKDFKNYKCEYCKGMGSIIQKRNMGFIVYESQERCPKCQGRGDQTPRHLICSKCGGRGVHHHLDHIVLDLPKGLPPSVPLIAKGKADEMIGYETGDLECYLHTVDHPRFTRVDEIHLSLEAVVSLSEALLGFTMEITRMDETTFTFTRKEILQPNERVIIKGEGMPIYGQPNQFGDLFITFTISFPSSLSSSDINRLKQLFPN